MHLKISGVRVMFQAVESFAFDEAACELVVRTVSGAEHRHSVLDKAEADKIADALIERMSLCDSL